MTLSLEHVRSQLSPRFPDLEKVDDFVLRFLRKASDEPYAVCYVDVSQRPPETAAALDEYQDRIIGQRFFEGRKSLQWSNYMYFLLESEPSKAIREIIESDRKYARKFIVTEAELESALSPPVYQVAEGAIDSSVLSTWTNLLGEKGIDAAVLNDESVPKKLDMIEAAFGRTGGPPPASTPIRSTPQPPFLKSVALRRFRKYPAQRQFEMGTVTLICGANGSGKTSLLEAIELLYCGRNKRNPKAGESFAIDATFVDGSSETASDSRPQSYYRTRNLGWYGQAESNTNTLYQSFSRFNFLNTDAAVGLAESKDDFDEDLSKLLVGPEASKTWREIERTSEKLDGKIKELSAQRNQLDLELLAIGRQINAASNVSVQSDAILAKLKEIVMLVRWPLQEGEPETAIAQLVKAIADYEAIVRQIIDFDWVESPTTIARLRAAIRKREALCEAGAKHLATLSKAISDERDAAQKMADAELKLSEAEELLRCVTEGLPERMAEVRRLESGIAKTAMILAGVSEDRLSKLAQFAITTTVAECVQSCGVIRTSLEKRAQDARAKHAAFTAQRNEAVSLGQRFRELAQQILATAANPDSCPLCHTEFSPGELITHIQAGLDQVLEEQATQLLTTLRQLETELASVRSTEEAAIWMNTACIRMSPSPPGTVGEFRNRALQSLQESTGLQQKLAEIQAELSAMKNAGVTPERYSQLVNRLLTPSVVSGIDAKKFLEELYLQLRTTKSTLLPSLEASRLSIRDARASAQSILETPLTTVDGLNKALSKIRESVASGTAMLARIEPYLLSYPWDEEKSLSEMLLTIESIRKLASDFESTLANERGSITVLSVGRQRKEQVERQLAGLVPRIEILSSAQHVLTRITSEHSLPGAMEEALKQNRAAIEAIFKRIHAPAEFSGLGPTMTTLVRKSDSTPATLHQISTGQRAAFALSLFLAQNVQLRSAPPLILIDDPIAHVDDLNCLSFLDYLRDVVIGGDRQVVFATANEKLAVLFERKFDFLGQEEFRRYDFKR